MKKTPLQYAAAGIGMFLVLFAIIWTCRLCAGPGKLRAANEKRPIELTPAAERAAVGYSSAKARVTVPERENADETLSRPVSGVVAAPFDEAADELPTPQPLPLRESAAAAQSTATVKPVAATQSNDSELEPIHFGKESAKKSPTLKAASTPKSSAPKSLSALKMSVTPKAPETEPLAIPQASPSLSIDDAPAPLPAPNLPDTPAPLPAPNSLPLSEPAPLALPQEASIFDAAPAANAALPAPAAPTPTASEPLAIPATPETVPAPMATAAPAPTEAPSTAPEMSANAEPMFANAVSEQTQSTMSEQAQNAVPKNILTAPTEQAQSVVPEKVASSQINPFENFAAPITQESAFFGESARPGNIALDGPQKAELTLQKELPAEIQVGCETTFKMIVKNVGSATAKNVILRDMVPAGTELSATEPRVEPTADGRLVWNAFDLPPNEERVFEYRIVPQVEGEIGSVASVSFAAEASGRTVCTRPQLKLSVASPTETLIGENVRLDISISNPGSGTAKNVVLTEEVPKQFRHPNGPTLNNKIGDLAPGETKQLALTLQTVAAGPVVNKMTVTAESGLTDTVETDVTVNAPELALEINGAAIRYLERSALYRLKVWNPGTAAAKGVRLTAELPPQMKFVATNNEGVYQESTHTVHWELVELPNGVAPGDIELTLLPSSAGAGTLNFRGEGAMNLSSSVSQEITVDGMPALSYEVTSLSDPVEVGRDALYEIKISNRGTKESTNVLLAILLPEPMEVVEADGPTRYTPQSGGIAFGPLGKIAAKEEVVYKLKTRCSLPGDHRVKVQVSSDDMEPLVKEESIRVFN